MFRDESSKVIQRAQSQRSGGQGASSPADQKANDAKPDEPKGDDSKKLPHSTQLAVRGPQHPPCAQGSRYMRPGASPQARISSTLEDRGFHFYIRRYLVGHPDEPRNLPDLKNYEWHFSPTLREASAALGLAALSNLTGDGRLLTAANAQYGNALRTAGKVMKSSDPLAADLASRLVVMLAMYEVSIAMNNPRPSVPCPRCANHSAN